jgi:nitronate monooxygenase
MQRSGPPIPAIVQAPMAGGPSTVELAAAVCGAGGLGFLAAGYVSAEEMATQTRQLRAATAAPFGVNLFMIRETTVDHATLAAYLGALEPEARRLGTHVGQPRFDDDGLDAKVAALVAAPVPVVSFAFGCPETATIRELRQAGSQVWVTVTSGAEAELAVAAGCDVVVAQGAEAGGHRSAFEDDGGEGALGALSLVRELVARVSVPVVAAGGIATQADVTVALAAGAAACQCGTAFLLADEAGTHPLHRAAVSSDASTAWTRAYTGRTARGVVTDFMREHPGAPDAYPQVHFATAPIRAAARAAGDRERMSLWAGTRHQLARSCSAGAVVRSLAPA